MLKQQGTFLIKHDAWSDFVTGTLNDLGIDQGIRDAVQPVINQGQNLLPPGGAIPNQPAAQTPKSIQQITNYASTAIGQLMAPKVFGVPVVVIGLGLVAVYFAVRKK